MTEKRKPPNAGKGRVKGVPNVATKKARLAVAAFLEQNSERIGAMLERIERCEGPLMAWECLLRLVQLHVPKTRAEEALPTPDSVKN